MMGGKIFGSEIRAFCQVSENHHGQIGENIATSLREKAGFWRQRWKDFQGKGGNFFV